MKSNFRMRFDERNIRFESKKKSAAMPIFLYGENSCKYFETRILSNIVAF